MTEKPRTAVAGVLLIVGVALAVLPSALHGNPPIDDAAATLRYVDGTSLWTIAHFANIAGVVLWAVAIAMIVPAFRFPRSLAAATRTVFTIAAAVFAIYFGLHALGLSTVAEQFAAAADRAAVVERAEALLLVLGSTAFVAQGLLGSAVAVLGLLLARTPGVNRTFGAVGAVAGVGWLVGALAIDFAIIVPCMAIAWLWLVVLGACLVRGRLPFGATATGAS